MYTQERARTHTRAEHIPNTDTLSQTGVIYHLPNYIKSKYALPKAFITSSDLCEICLRNTRKLYLYTNQVVFHG
jgi:hypothetical protein